MSVTDGIVFLSGMIQDRFAFRSTRFYELMADVSYIYILKMDDASIQLSDQIVLPPHSHTMDTHNMM